MPRGREYPRSVQRPHRKMESPEKKIESVLTSERGEGPSVGAGGTGGVTGVPPPMLEEVKVGR